MGLAASQARLLFLTRRLSDLELRAQVISNAKIRLADESTAASNEYSRALDKKKIQVLTGVSAAAGNTYSDATIANLTTYNPNYGTLNQPRMIQDAAGRMLVSQKTADAYNGAMELPMQFDKGWGSAKAFQQTYKDLTSCLKALLGYISADDYKSQHSGASDADVTKAKQQIDYYTNMYNGAEGYMQKLGYTSNPNNTNPSLQYDQGAATYYAKQFNAMQGSSGTYVVSDKDINSYEYLEAQTQANGIFLYEEKQQSDGTYKYENVSWTSGDNNIQEVNDDKQTAKAEAKYEATMADIQSKDKRFDLQLKQVDTEHQAAQTEIDSVKKIIDKNIDRSFKIFQA